MGTHENIQQEIQQQQVLQQRQQQLDSVQNALQTISTQQQQQQQQLSTTQTACDRQVERNTGLQTGIQQVGMSQETLTKTLDQKLQAANKIFSEKL